MTCFEPYYAASELIRPLVICISILVLIEFATLFMFWFDVDRPFLFIFHVLSALISVFSCGVVLHVWR